jgi:hypothetical protein
MRIVFGLYNINIKQYKPSDLGITDESLKDYTFAVKQRIFHIFWIPIFPVKKIYALVDRNNVAYHATYDLKHVIKQSEKVRTPWYSFALPILAIIIVAGMWISDTIDQHRYKVNEEVRKDNFIEHTTELSKHIKKDDILILYSSGDWSSDESHSYGAKLALCVDSIVKNEYFFKAEAFGSYGENVPQTNEEFINYFKDPNSFFSNKVYTKSEILDFIGRKSSNENEYGLDGGYDLGGTRYILHHKIALNRPNLRMELNTTSMNEVTYSMIYFGPIARIKKFKKLNDFDGTPVYNKILANQENVQFTTNLTLQGVSEDDDLEFQLTLEDEDGKEYKFHVKKVGSSMFCTLL